jgi:hypothetical protein
MRSSLSSANEIKLMAVRHLSSLLIIPETLNPTHTPILNEIRASHSTGIDSGSNDPAYCVVLGSSSRRIARIIASRFCCFTCRCAKRKVGSAVPVVRLDVVRVQRDRLVGVQQRSDTVLELAIGECTVSSSSNSIFRPASESRSDSAAATKRYRIWQRSILSGS